MATRWMQQKRAKLIKQNAALPYMLNTSTVVTPDNPEPFRKAETPKARKPRNLVKDGNGHYRPAKVSHLAGGTVPDRHSPIYYATDWTPEVRLIRAR